MLDIDKCKKTLENHFTNLTYEEFLAILEELCPEFLFCEESPCLELSHSNDLELDRQNTEETKLDRGSLSDEFMNGKIDFYSVFNSSGIFSAYSQLWAECNCSIVVNREWWILHWLV
jgi:hypothetical protein